MLALATSAPKGITALAQLLVLLGALLEHTTMRKDKASVNGVLRDIIARQRPCHLLTIHVLVGIIV